MYRQALVIGSLGLALAACQTTSNAPASVKGECNVFTDPGFSVRGATRKDQRWISGTQEKGIEVCGWERPPPPPPKVDARATTATPVAAKKKRRWFGS